VHLVAHVVREEVGVPMRRVTGYETVATTTQPAAWLPYVAVGGAVLAGVGALLAFRPSDSSSSSPALESSLGTQPVLGWSLIGVGTVLVLPWLFTTSGTTMSERPFSRDERDPEAAPAQTRSSPAPGVTVHINHDHQTLASQSTSPSGDAAFDLSQLLPETAIYGARPWQELTLRTTSGAQVRHGMVDLPLHLADMEYAGFRTSPTAEQADQFRRRYPNDPRIATLDSLLRVAGPEPSTLPSPSLSSNSSDWIGLSNNDPAALERFAAREPADVYVAEAQCRLASLQQDPSTRQFALERCRGTLNMFPEPSDALERAVRLRAVQERDAAIAAAESAVGARAPETEPAPVAARSSTTRHDEGERSLSLESRLQGAITRCRSDASVDQARRAYTILRALRDQVDRSRYNAYRTQIDVACHSSSGALGIAL